MIRKTTVTSLLIGICTALSAQIRVADIHFDRTNYNFGTINFRSGLIQTEFRLTNNSSDALVIRDIKADCGCTVPSWPKEPIKPGETAVIGVTFDPDNYAGEIEKKVEVLANFQDAITVPLRITGVIRRPINTQTERIPGQFGYLHMPSNIAAFGSIPNKGSYRQEIMLINEYNRPLKLKKVSRKPDYLQIDFPEDKTMEPGDTLRIPVILQADKVNDLGLINEVALFETGDIFFPTKSIEITFELIQDFGTPGKKALRKAPLIELSTQVIEMGSMVQGQKMRKKFLITNKGKRDLQILKVSSDCACALLEFSDAPILRGESREVTVQFDALFKSGEQRKFIYLYTNDPRQPKIQIEVRASVQD
ncbi:MAG: DUF1573 domain-containing protein [Flavobacteriales bacterium]|nr:DUF1573 domain-containing protein [Flavobacteriales bacterium]